MGRVRLILISLTALVIALGAAFVARGFATPRQPKTVIVQAVAPPPKPTVNVLTAKRDLQVGDRLDASNIAWRPWPADGLSAVYVTDGASATSAPTDMQGKAMAAAGGAAGLAKSAVGASDPGRMAGWFGAVVRQTVNAGEPITEKKVVHAGASGVLAVTLQPGMRAMSLPLSAESGAGGFILPGDHVDVVQIQKSPTGVQAATVMRNVRVLAIDQSTRADTSKSIAQIGAQATIELSPVQAEDMVLARAQGELTLVLRSYADAAGSASTGDIRRSMETPVVKVFRSGQESEVKVAR